MKDETNPLSPLPPSPEELARYHRQRKECPDPSKYQAYQFQPVETQSCFKMAQITLQAFDDSGMRHEHIVFTLACMIQIKQVCDNVTPEQMDYTLKCMRESIAGSVRRPEQPKPGTFEGERCNREDGTASLCDGVIATHPVSGCACHINPPCTACTEPRNYCPHCGWHESDGE